MRYLDLMRKVYPVACMLIAAIMLLSAAFYNGYPLVTADAATYLDSGFGLETPFDRPITYGLFVRLISLNGFSLWPVVGLQTTIVAALLYGLLRQLMSRPRACISLLIISAILTIATPLSWVVSALMPDVFTPVALLSMLLLVTAKMRKGRRVALYALYFVSISMHMSHVLLFGLLIVLLFLLRKWIAGAQRRAYFGLAKMSILLILTAGAIATMGSALSKSRHVFFMGAMVERGVAKTYLDEYCPTIPYRLCAYKDVLPVHGYDFVWSDDGPLQHTGGWQDSREEYNQIILATLTKPKYIRLQISSSFRATITQLQLFKAGDGNVAFDARSEVYRSVAKCLPREATAFSQSRQNTGRLLPTPVWQTIMNIVIVVSTLLTILLAFPQLWRDPLIRTVIFMLLLAVIVNAWDCATFANAIDRLGARMIWMVPLAVMILIACLLFPQTGQKVGAEHTESAA